MRLSKQQITNTINPMVQSAAIRVGELSFEVNAVVHPNFCRRHQICAVHKLLHTRWDSGTGGASGTAHPAKMMPPRLFGHGGTGVDQTAASNLSTRTVNKRGRPGTEVGARRALWLPSPFSMTPASMSARAASFPPIPGKTVCQLSEVR